MGTSTEPGRSSAARAGPAASAPSSRLVSTGSSPGSRDSMASTRREGCGPGATANASAQPLGNSEGNCATPHALYESAVRFMASTTPHLAGGLYFTGDFVEAGAADAW